MRYSAVRIATGVVAATSLLVSLSGCGSDKPSRPQSVAGIATLKCDTNKKVATVKVTNPDSGKVVKTYYFSLLETQVTTACSGLTSPASASGLSADYTLMAVRQQFGKGWHTGVIEATDDPAKVSKFRDLSGDVDKNTPFVTQSAGAFGPDGKLYAVQQDGETADENGSHVLLVIDPNSGDTETLNKQVTFTNTDEDGHSYAPVAPFNRSFYFLPGSEKLEAEGNPNKVLSPDGDWGFWKNVDDNFVYGDLQKAGDKSKLPIADNPHVPGSDDARATIEPRIYIDKKRFIGTSHAAVYQVTVRRGDASLDEIKLDVKEVRDLTRSPDGKQMALVVTVGNTVTLRTADLSVGSKIKTRIVSTIGKGDQTPAAILGWTD